MKWEYWEAPIHLPTWNEAGKNGWELVTIVNGTAYFKRQIKK